MHHDERHVVLLPVSSGTLRVQAMCAVEVPMIRSQDYDGVRREAERVEFIEQRVDVAIDVAKAVEVVVMPPEPAPVFVSDVADETVMRPDVIDMRGRPTGCV